MLHIETGYPKLDGRRWYHRFRPLTERAGGCNVRRDIRNNHGPLGAIYTTPKEGDSWTFVDLIPTGLSDPLEPAWGGWAGRYGPRSNDPLNTAGPYACARHRWPRTCGTRWLCITSATGPTKRI